MQGVENGHTAPARGSSRPSRQAAAAEDDDDDDDEIYEPPVKSLLICFDKKNITVSFWSIFFIFKLRHKKREISTYIYVLYWCICVYYAI